MIKHWDEITAFQRRMGTYGLRANSLALFMEVAELVDSFSWKPWREHQPADLENAKREIVDCLFFLHHIAEGAGITGADLEIKFVEVMANNVKRYIDGDFSKEDE